MSSKNAFKVLYDFRAVGPTELSVTKNDIVIAISPEERGWIKVKPLKGAAGQEGFVPFAYLKPTSVIARPRGVTQPAPAAPVPVASSVPHVELSGETAAVQHAECAVCFKAMISKKPICCLTKADGKRACRHYFHRGCIDRLIFERKLGSKGCPICSVMCTGALDVPDYESDPEEWFKVVDYDRNYKLNKGEVIAILKALVDVDYRLVESQVDTFWQKWDRNGDGTVSFQEMMHPTTGLITYVRMTYPGSKDKPEPTPPKLSKSSMKEFFHFWDEDKSGALCLDEVVRAVVKTFHMGDTSHSEGLKATLGTLWDMFDHDGSGFVEEDEFCKEGGLGEMLLVNYSALN